MAVIEEFPMEVVSAGPALVRETDGQIFPVPPWGLVVGRADWCTLRLEDGTISRAHAQVVPQGDGVVIRDAGSTNGTYLNGRRVGSAPLKDGDHVRVGSVCFRYRAKPAPAAAETSAPDRRLTHALEALRTLSAGLAGAEEERTAFRLVSDFIVAELDPDRLFVARTNAEEEPKVAVVRTRPDLDRKLALAPVPRTPLRRVLKSRQSFCPSAQKLSEPEGTSISMRAASLGSVLAVPLVGRERALGAIQAERFGERPPFDEVDVLLAEVAANALAGALGTGRLVAVPPEELEVAGPAL